MKISAILTALYRHMPAYVALLIVGFCAGRGSRAANDRATKAWLDSAAVRESTFAALRAQSARDSARADSSASAARRTVTIVRTVLQPQLDTATTTRDSLLLLVAQRDSLLKSVHQWALAYASLSASRAADRARADTAERALLRSDELLRQARGSRCGIQVGPGIGVSGAGVRAELVQLQLGCRIRIP